MERPINIDCLLEVGFRIPLAQKNIKSVSRSGSTARYDLNNHIYTIYYWKRVAPRDGFEPPAKRLTVACSTAELPGNNV